MQVVSMSLILKTENYKKQNGHQMESIKCISPVMTETNLQTKNNEQKEKCNIDFF